MAIDAWTHCVHVQSQAGHVVILYVCAACYIACEREENEDEDDDAHVAEWMWRILGSTLLYWAEVCGLGYGTNKAEHVRNI